MTLGEAEKPLGRVLRCWRGMAGYGAAMGRTPAIAPPYVGQCPPLGSVVYAIGGGICQVQNNGLFLRFKFII